MKRLFAMPLAALVLFGLTAAFAPVAQATPTKTVPCSGCHGGANVPVEAILSTTVGTTATYNVRAPAADAIAVFSGATKVGSTIIGTSGQFAVPVGKTYTVFAIAGPTTGDGIGSTSVSPVALPTLTKTQIAGSDRYATSIATSRSTFATGSCDSVVLATGRNFPDALGASGLAGVAGCPIILVDGLAAAANTATKAEIVRLTQGKTTRTVYIAGSTSVVSTDVATSLGSGLGVVVVTRLAGATRYDTANEIAKRARILMTSKGIAYGGKALVVTGSDYHDALLAGPLAYRSRIPLLLVGASVTTALTNTMATVGVNKVEIIGSTTWVPATVATALGTALGASNVTRPCSIADPYAQGVAVANWAVSSYGFTWSGVGIATGENYPDALGAAPVQGKAGNPLLYTPATTANTAANTTVRAALAAHKFQIRLLRYFGSTAAVSQTVRNGLEAALE